jgi:hypothetical protein
VNWEIVLGALTGAAGTLLLAGIGYAAYRAGGVALAFYRLMQRGVRAAEGIQGELAYMRSLTGGQLGEQQMGGDQDETHHANPQYVPTRAAEPRATIPFPPAFMDRFPQEPVPDATREDTDMELLNQTDADLVEIEKLEQMRQSGMEVEDSDAVHPGVEVDSK